MLSCKNVNSCLHRVKTQLHEMKRLGYIIRILNHPIKIKLGKLELGKLELGKVP